MVLLYSSNITFCIFLKCMFTTEMFSTALYATYVMYVNDIASNAYGVYTWYRREHMRKEFMYVEVTIV